MRDGLFVRNRLFVRDRQLVRDGQFVRRLLGDRLGLPRAAERNFLRPNRLLGDDLVRRLDGDRLGLNHCVFVRRLAAEADLLFPNGLLGGRRFRGDGLFNFRLIRRRGRNGVAVDGVSRILAFERELLLEGGRRRRVGYRRLVCVGLLLGLAPEGHFLLPK